MKKFDCKLCKLFTIIVLTIILFTNPSITYAEGEQSLGDEELTITLHLKANDNLSGLSKVMISSNSEFKDAQWEDYTEEKELILNKNAEEKIVYIKYMDKAGNVSEVNSKEIPEILFEESIVINNDDVYTNKDKITLKINTTEDAEEMSLSSDNVNWNDWIKFKNEIEYAVKGDDGEKKIYIQFKDKDGKKIKKLVPAVFIYDKTSSTIENIKLSLDEKTNKVNISVEINDNLSGVQYKKWTAGEVDLGYFENQGTEFNENSIVVDENGDYTFYVEDRAGNVSIEKFTVNIIKNDIEDKEIIDNNDNNIEEKSKENTDKTNNVEEKTINQDETNNVEETNINQDETNNRDNTNDNNTIGEKDNSDVKNKNNDENITESEKANKDKETTEKEDDVEENNDKEDNENDTVLKEKDTKDQNNKSEEKGNGICLYCWHLYVLILLLIYLAYKKYKEKKNKDK
ncbi:hypothetical protein [Oceanirhabdus seepicola]|uniref:Uncharacterized protein n=1 Tax=Oceanirhabdus seepicola TaxID=2828781 RepID=A0A9J6NWC0_9CLOT|nr:hypothetical protein [Oceanirhabdus seepicola]MCM1988356.1 hypothetical protein [Oceanirhabdus seepicola]